MRVRFTAMGCPCELQLSGPDARRVATLAVAEVRRLDAKYTSYRDDSFLAEINRAAAAGGAIEVDEETAALLDYAEACFRESGGRFDISAGPLARLWRCAGAHCPTRAIANWSRRAVAAAREKPWLAFPVDGWSRFGGV